jgi:hypothetical protein
MRKMVKTTRVVEGGVTPFVPLDDIDPNDY